MLRTPTGFNAIRTWCWSYWLLPKKIQKEYEKENNQIKEHEYERRGVYPNHTFNLEEDTRRIEDDLDQTIESMYEDDLAVGLTLKKRK